MCYVQIQFPQGSQQFMVYHIAGKFGRKNLWRIYSFQVFGGKSLTNE